MSRIWRRGSRVAEVVSEDGARVALLNVDTDRPLVLTGSAAVIWALVDGQRTEQELLSELEDTYGADPGSALSAQIHAELARFLGELAGQGLIA